jgi:DNA-binding response OmpR family regulator
MEPLDTRVILLVEDDYVIARQLARKLTAAGADVLGPVPDVTRALRLIAETAHIDGAVLDVNVRGDMVYPVAEALRARNAGSA